ncbi:hypothetical protein [Maliponia aquimaris]|uniref:Uncharacterized protein n=1 Tax=Maliponia aquimaris TaxID=1673631 RepID=A0A238L5Z8_9RHOB|nr:hypothetical protein [Maliponia aquimaris]SMX50417.1 hypothetical protein MAA8898_04774 [Maliponia aquimaris]
MTWFETLAGVPEGSPDAARAAFDCDGEFLIARKTGRRMRAGRLSLPSLAELRADAPPACDVPSTFRQVVADVRALHKDPANTGALFQVASQFNLLEMVGPSVTPSDGVTRYALDPTQGPACAIACGAGTIWRNYFTPLSGGLGQTEVQIDTLADLGAAFGNGQGALWQMRNGYALPRPGDLAAVAGQLRGLDAGGKDHLRGLLRIGLHEDCEVTIAPTGHVVSQVYCSALPVAYGGGALSEWELFARLVLEAAYEATMLCALRNAARGASNRVFLTLLGGGAFGNGKGWILDAVARALGLVRDHGLEVRVVSYGRPDAEVTRMLKSIPSR